MQHGIPFSTSVARLFHEILPRVDTVIANNGEFVYNIFKSELFRHALLSEINLLDSKQLLCSQYLTVDTLKLLDVRGSPKNPSLKELLKFTTGETLPEQRTATENIEYLRKSLNVLVEKKQALIVPYRQ
jgi:hypothetical protein